MNKKICPACGAETLILNTEIQILNEPYGGQKEIEIKKYHCTTCDSDGDFFNENEEIINSSLDLLKVQSMKNIISDFINKKKISMSAIERVLSLPQRTLTKWKNSGKKPSAAVSALMKYLKTFPWLLEVAENNFDYDIAQKIYISSAIQKFLMTMNFNAKELNQAGIISTSSSTLVYFNYKSPQKSDINYFTENDYTSVSTNSEQNLLMNETK